jgi:hypothetical protein
MTIPADIDHVKDGNGMVTEVLIRMKIDPKDGIVQRAIGNWFDTQGKDGRMAIQLSAWDPDGDKRANERDITVLAQPGSC